MCIMSAARSAATGTATAIDTIDVATRDPASYTASGSWRMCVSPNHMLKVRRVDDAGVTHEASDMRGVTTAIAMPCPTSMLDLLTTYCGLELHLCVLSPDLLVVLDIDAALAATCLLPQKQQTTLSYMYGWACTRSPKKTVVTCTAGTHHIVFEATSVRDERAQRRELLLAAHRHYGPVRPLATTPPHPCVRRVVNVNSILRGGTLSITNIHGDVLCEAVGVLSNFRKLEVLVCTDATSVSYDEFCLRHMCMPGNGLTTTEPSLGDVARAKEYFEYLRPLLPPPRSWSNLLLDRESFRAGVVVPLELDVDVPVCFNVAAWLPRALFPGLPEPRFEALRDWRRLVTDFDEHIITCTDPHLGVHYAIDVCY